MKAQADPPKPAANPFSFFGGGKKAREAPPDRNHLFAVRTPACGLLRSFAAAVTS